MYAAVFKVTNQCPTVQHRNSAQGYVAAGQEGGLGEKGYMYMHS